MTRVRISTTVDQDLLTQARTTHGAATDSSLVEDALRELLRRHRRDEIDRAYETGYAREVDDDAWGDIVEWQTGVAAARGRTA